MQGQRRRVPWFDQVTGGEDSAEEDTETCDDDVSYPQEIVLPADDGSSG
jgi:hypothetical protein